jgi:prepilin-type N-terminal cleavage/methylation domain-containing protein
MIKIMKMNKKGLALSSSKGFTLIELLVVIAIIGILSSVVLASLNTARGKGSDAKIKANLSGLRTAAEIYYDNNSSYGVATDSCSGGMFSNTVMLPYTTSSNYPGSPSLSCHSSGSAYAVSVPLTSAPDANTDNWCVDSVGTSKAIAVPLAIGATNC